MKPLICRDTGFDRHAIDEGEQLNRCLPDMRMKFTALT
jgi:hypothetical protein